MYQASISEIYGATRVLLQPLLVVYNGKKLFINVKSCLELQEVVNFKKLCAWPKCNKMFRNSYLVEKIEFDVLLDC